MRISDWSSDVCSSDLLAYGPPLRTRDTLPTDVPAALATSRIVGRRVIQLAFSTITADRPSLDARPAMECPWGQASDRKRVVEGKSVSVRVDLGGRRIIKKKIKSKHTYTT